MCYSVTYARELPPIGTVKYSYTLHYDNIAALQARVILSVKGLRMTVVGFPVLARRLPRCIWPRDFILRFEELHTQSSRDVRRDMAMHQPCAWVVCFKRKNNPTAGGQECHVTSRWIFEA